MNHFSSLSFIPDSLFLVFFSDFKKIINIIFYFISNITLFLKFYFIQISKIILNSLKVYCDNLFLKGNLNFIP